MDEIPRTTGKRRPACFRKAGSDRVPRRLRPLALVAAALLLLPGLANAAKLAPYKVDKTKISVSGLSAGGYMAVQLHVAYSATFMGAGVLAAGPYYCAEKDSGKATGRCMDGDGGFPFSVLDKPCGAERTTAMPGWTHFRDITDGFAAAGKIDPTSGLAGDKVWLFNGNCDDLVFDTPTDTLKDYYAHYAGAANVAYARNTVNVEHGFPTDSFGSACTVLGDPYINTGAACAYDAAGHLLKHLYGANLQPKSAAVAANLISFDQREFSSHASLGEEGYLYVPQKCRDGSTACKLHVALHGCKQSRYQAGLGDKFARHTGYNAWAEANDIIVLYPQTGTGATNHCFDWWGYTGNDYATKSGVQMLAVKKMIDRVTGDDPGTGGGTTPVLSCTSASNRDHYHANRATSWWFGFFYHAKGSGAALGGGNTVTALKETSPGYYDLVRSCTR